MTEEVIVDWGTVGCKNLGIIGVEVMVICSVAFETFHVGLSYTILFVVVVNSTRQITPLLFSVGIRPGVFITHVSVTDKIVPMTSHIHALIHPSIIHTLRLVIKPFNRDQIAHLMPTHTPARTSTIIRLILLSIRSSVQMIAIMEPVYLVSALEHQIHHVSLTIIVPVRLFSIT